MFLVENPKNLLGENPVVDSSNSELIKQVYRKVQAFHSQSWGDIIYR